jgi:Slime mold cyclic AMP receptor
MEEYPAICTCCILSIVGNLVIFTGFYKVPEIRSIYEYQFVFIFTVFDFVQLLSTLIPTPLYSSGGLCQTQGILIQITSLCGILWVGFIAIAMFYEVVLSRQRFSKGFIVPILVIISISVISAIVPLFYQDYKLLGWWCWFESQDDEQDYLFRFLLFYGIVWIVIIINLIITFSIMWKSKKEVLYDLVGMRLVSRLKWYPWILFFCYLPLTIGRIMDGTTEVPYYFSLVASCINLLIGFFNSIPFLLSDKIKPRILGNYVNNETMHQLNSFR